MTTYSQSQLQLLKVLQIAPLQLNAAQAGNTAGLDTESHEPDQAQLLAQDILAILPDGCRWQIKDTLLHPILQQKMLLTPPLIQLKTAEQKKALWSLLSKNHEN